MNHDLSDAIKLGSLYLTSTQNVDGSFTGYASGPKGPFMDNDPTKTTFNASLILSAISEAKELHDTPLFEGLKKFIISEKDDDWTYNYWAKDSINQKVRYCPNDLDDTFCAYNSLLRADSDVVTPEALVALTKILLATESNVGGPYRTWVVKNSSDKPWLDIDPAVNSNIAFFLSQVASIPAGLKKYLEDAIDNQVLESPYYYTVLPTLYYLSRCPLQNITKCADLLPSSYDELSSLEIALSANVLLRLKRYGDAAPLIALLLKLQHDDGSWDGGCFSIDQYQGDVLCYNGCAALTTAFAIEALAQYREHSSKRILSSRSSSNMQGNQVFTHAQTLSDALPHHLRTQMKMQLENIRSSGNGEEILKNALLLHRSLKSKPQISELNFQTLGSANLYGWVAYTIYDDFIDDEGDPRMMSVANAAHRISFETFLLAQPENTSYQKYVRSVFNLIDEANAWETLYCRASVTEKTIQISQVPDYGKLESLSNRSLGHILPPLSVMGLAGHPVGSNSFLQLESALRNYLVAKQLNDDAHDWQEDFLKGHMSYVVATTMQELGIQPGAYDKRDLLHRMQQQFWRHAILTICNQIEQCISKGEINLRAIDAIAPDSDIFLLFEKLLKILKNTRKEQTDTLEFLKLF